MNQLQQEIKDFHEKLKPTLQAGVFERFKQWSVTGNRSLLICCFVRQIGKSDLGII